MKKPTDSSTLVSVLAALDWGEETTYAIGHKSPDTDAVCAAVAYAGLMRALGYRCEARIAGPLNRETQFIARQWRLPVPEVMKEVKPGTRLILIDHAEYAQAVDGAPQARLLQVIDHHGIGDICEQNLVFYQAMPVGATCTIVYLLYRDSGVEVDDETARVLLAGLVSDTRNLKKSTTTPLDRQMWNDLTAQLGLTAADVDACYKGMVEASRDLSGLTDKEIFLAYYKEYKLEGVKLGIANLEGTGDAPVDAFLDRMLAVMPEVLAESGNAMLFARLFIRKGTYLLYHGAGSRSLAERAFGPSLREGICHVDARLSRKTDIVPMLTAVIRQDAGRDGGRDGGEEK